MVAGSQLAVSGTGVFATFSATMTRAAKKAVSVMLASGPLTSLSLGRDITRLNGRVGFFRNPSSETSSLKPFPTLPPGRSPLNCKSICEFSLNDPAANSSGFHSAVFPLPPFYCHVRCARERRMFLLQQQLASRLERRQLRCLSTAPCSVVLFLHSGSVVGMGVSCTLSRTIWSRLDDLLIDPYLRLVEVDS